MKTSLTSRWGMAFAASLLLVFTLEAGTLNESSFLARSFPEKVGDFTRLSAHRNAAAIHDNVIDAAAAKYASGASEITWNGTAFSNAEAAFAMLETTINTYQKDGAGVSSIKNTEGKVRYAVIEAKEAIICCWVNKQRRNLFFVAIGQQPEIERFMRAETTW